MKKYGLVLFVVAIIIGGYIGFEAFQPPKIMFDEQTVTLEDVSTLEDPSLAVTMGHLKEMSKAPHPIGSQENIRVRKYLVDQMEQMGYVVEQDAYNIEVTEKVATRATVDGENLGTEIEGVNLMAIAEGKNSQATTFVVAHYDSTTFGPGAADDAIAVSAILEAMRLAKVNQPQNTLVFLITDGEEVGLTGAEHFVSTHPEWRDKADFLINFEARGNRGGLVMFQTADNNYRMLRHLADGATYPIAVSMATEVYNRVPNGTDLTQFLNAGYDGVMNFAVVEGAEHYHTPTDSYEEINRNTANHYLLMITDLTDYFGNVTNVERTAKVDAIYFPVYKGKLIILKQTTGFILSAIGVLVACAWIISQIGSKAITFKKLGQSFLLIIVSLTCAGIIGKIAVWLTNNVFHIEKNASAYLRWDGSIYMFASLVLISLIGTFMMIRYCNKKWALHYNIIGSYLVLLAIGTIATCLIVPGASYLFFIPLLTLLLILYVQVWMKQKDKGVETLTIGATVFGFVQAILYTPVIYLLFVALTIPSLPLVGLLTSFVVIGCASLFENKLK